jgi:hypothetical protein
MLAQRVVPALPGLNSDSAKRDVRGGVKIIPHVTFPLPGSINNLFPDKFHSSYLWLGTKVKAVRNYPEDSIRHIYFKRNGS